MMVSQRIWLPISNSMNIGNLRRVYKEDGLLAALSRVMVVITNKLRLSIYNTIHRNASEYRSPTLDEIDLIDRQFTAAGYTLKPLVLDTAKLLHFKQSMYFPDTYYGGAGSDVWDEKLLEHFIAHELAIADLKEGDIYIDIAAYCSPWVKILRDSEKLQAYAIDLQICPEYRHHDYYLDQDATNTMFENSSVSAASLQCAYEMFTNDSDIRLISELGRILKPGGKVIILPLYMHTHYCCYATPEYYGKGMNDAGAIEYIRRDMLGVPSSRKYDVEQLQKRVLETASNYNLACIIYKLNITPDLGGNIYCHYILELSK